MQSQREIVNLYVEINKSEPIQEIDLPENIATDRKRIIDDATMSLHATFLDMFKPTARCRPPHVHLPCMPS